MVALIAFTVFGVAGVGMMNFNFNTGGVIAAAYAQPSSSNSRACPEGFSLNRGVCQAEPELSCQYLLDQGYPPIRISSTDDGQQCRIAHYSLPLCEEGFYDWWHNQCEDPVGFDANFPTENQDIYCEDDKDLEFVDVDWVCVTYEIVPAEASEECDVGEFNEKSGMCETRPGNRNSRN
jgi:hypothetical protein